jgi:polysaccharide biosynthesis transport protein
MSKNFELLRRARIGETLFIEPLGDSPAVNVAPVCSDGNIVRNEAFEADQREALLSGRELSGPAQEELIKLVQRVFVSPNSHSPRVVSFSNVEGNGSSEICSRTGAVLAAQGSGSVCLVDANLDAPSLHRLFGVDKFPGLMDAMVKPGPVKDFAVLITGRNLWLIPPGSPTTGAPGLFGSDRLRSRMAELREEFDYVLIDAPPIASYGNAVLLGQIADGVILVVEANSTRRETARMAKETLEGANVKLLGAILNNRTFPIPEALYRRL